MKLATLLLWVTSSLVLARPAPAQAPAADSPEAQSARRVLDPRHRAGRASADLVRELVGIGPRGAPVLVGLLTGVLPGTDWEESGLTLEETRAARGDEDLLLQEALRGLPSAAVAQALSGICGGTAPLDRRLVGLHLLAEVGEGSQAVRCWREIGAGIEEIHLQRAYVRAQLESALARCLERSPAGFEPLRGGLRDWEPRLLPAIARACSEARRRPGVEVLAGLRGLDRELDLELLRSLPALAAATRGALGDPELAWVRGFLGDEAPEVRIDALLGLGRACDPDSAALLVDALADADPRVAQAALWSLRHVSGLRRFDEREEWASWLRDESAWSDDSRAACIRALESGEAATVVRALHELTLHPLYRHENARAVSVLCESEDVAVLSAACSALRAFDSMAAADALLGLLGRGDEALRALAQQALVELCGQKLGPEPEPWQALLGS